MMLQLLLLVLQLALVATTVVYVLRLRRTAARLRHCESEIGSMKSNLGRRMAELRLEKEAILRKRGAAAWFARQVGWHVRPDQWGELASKLDAADFDKLLDVFDASTDHELRQRVTASSRAITVLRTVVDHPQNVSLDKLDKMLRSPRRPPPPGAIVMLVEESPGPSDADGN